MNLEQIRRTYHKVICRHILGYQAGIPNIADGSRKTSIQIAEGLVTRIGYPLHPDPPSWPEANELFESLTFDYLQKAFRSIQHLRPGESVFSVHRDTPVFDQYEHLANLSNTLRQHPDFYATWGDYLITPDILVGRRPVLDDQIVQGVNILRGQIATLTPLRASNSPEPKLILHASISCKWTIRSDRAQNIRTEALNLIRNRKGHVPHVAVVTAEPLPTRLASLALGTGDLDCVYHFALNELQEAVGEVGSEDQLDMLRGMIDGRRLRDISDLPFDLAI